MVVAFFNVGMSDAVYWRLTGPDGEPKDISAVTAWRLDLRRGEEAVITINDQTAFTKETVDGIDVVVVRLGGLDWQALGITDGAYRARLVAVEPSYPDGAAWGESRGFDDVVYFMEA